MNFAFHPEAKAKFLEAIAYYEERAPGLGLVLSADVRAAIQRILVFPHAWQVLDGEGSRSSGVSPPMFHAEFDGIHRFGLVDGKVLGLVSFRQGKQDVETIAFQRFRIGFIVEENGNFPYGGAVIVFGADGVDVHIFSPNMGFCQYIGGAS